MKLKTLYEDNNNIYYKYLKKDEGKIIHKIPGYCCKGTKSSSFMKRVVSKAPNRTIYWFEFDKPLTLIGDNSDLLMGWDWQPDFDKMDSNEAKEFILNWEPYTGDSDIEFKNLMRKFYSSIWSHKPGWTIGDRHGECYGLSVITVPVTMYRVN